MYDMVHGILLSTRDNVNFVNEVFHQVNVSSFACISFGLKKKKKLFWLEHVNCVAI